MTKGAKDYEKDYTHPEMRERIKEELKASDKGGPAGKWTARKAQMLTQEYEEQGGGYEHEDQPTEQQRSLERWTEEQWQTADGSAQARDGEKTDRYLPKKAWEEMSADEQERTRERKQEASKRGQGDVANTSGAKQARTEAKLDEMNADDAVKRAKNMSPDEAQQALEHEQQHRDRTTVEQKLEKVAAQD